MLQNLIFTNVYKKGCFRPFFVAIRAVKPLSISLGCLSDLFRASTYSLWEDLYNQVKRLGIVAGRGPCL